MMYLMIVFFFSSRRRHTRCLSDWSSDVCSSDLSVADPIAYLFACVKHCALDWQRSRRRQVRREEQAARPEVDAMFVGRSEERRVGKECRARWWTEQYKKNVHMTT